MLDCNRTGNYPGRSHCALARVCSALTRGSGQRSNSQGRLGVRTEVLNAHLFESLAKLRALTDTWLRIYNGERPHLYYRNTELSQRSSTLLSSCVAPAAYTRVSFLLKTATLLRFPPNVPPAWRSCRMR